ncbi:membrane protein [Altererythrobacter atlanticus]|uniref:Uncharacterized protein n=1 Tax=Croceibacterium atlanticum TaxID=1267766 RepID=A0A0F7KR36_9SPHN|nr:YihY/virulence factor BrkB family protein [Croceibacterium atlanticum]AKH42054.1 hypothetical protein WYH_01006 [Croceibacterium atlanticum]MBB5733378.1 membrane protein [Croceibacterium atlanticum]
MTDSPVKDTADNKARRAWRIAMRSWARSGEDNLGIIAAGIAFNAFLAMVPLLTTVVLSYGLVASPEQVTRDIARLAQFLPRDAASLVGDQLRGMVETAGTAAGFGLLLSLAIALYGALRGATGVMTALNQVCRTEETRSFLRQTMVALGITVTMVALFLLASLALSVVNFLADLLPDLGGLLPMAQLAFWIGTAVFTSIGIAQIYARAPDRPDKVKRWLTPGSAIATLVWIAATLAFSFYVRNFGSYNATYGALGAAIVLLTWLYLSAYILLLGAEVNQVIAEVDEAE